MLLKIKCIIEFIFSLIKLDLHSPQTNFLKKKILTMSYLSRGKKKHSHLRYLLFSVIIAYNILLTVSHKIIAHKYGTHSHRRGMLHKIVVHNR